jgi:hypothetical protein
MTENPLVRQVDLRSGAAFARILVTTLQATVGGAQLLPVLRAGVHAHCPQCQFRLFGEDVLALAGSESPDPQVSAKLHRLAQGFCGRQGCEALFYEFQFDAVESVDWEQVLAQVEASGGPQATETAMAEQDLAGRKAAAKRRTRLRVAIGFGVVLLLLAVRHVMTGGTIPFVREAQHFTADPASIPRLGETNLVVDGAGKGATGRVFRAAPEPEGR